MSLEEGFIDHAGVSRAAVEKASNAVAGVVTRVPRIVIRETFGR